MREELDGREWVEKWENEMAVERNRKGKSKVRGILRIAKNNKRLKKGGMKKEKMS